MVMLFHPLVYQPTSFIQYTYLPRTLPEVTSEDESFITGFVVIDGTTGSSIDKEPGPKQCLPKPWLALHSNRKN